MTTDADDIPEFIGDDDQLLNALKHMLTMRSLNKTEKVVVKGAIDAIEEMRDQILEMCEYD